VKNLVADSKFHDDVLCQLLDAARLNLIGEEAKKALNLVMELAIRHQIFHSTRGS
jgi:hypothetical protein